MREFGTARQACKLSCLYWIFKTVAIPDYQKTVGFKGLTFLRNIKNDEGHFKLITYWDNVEVIKNFAGQDFEKAKYYLEDNNFLLEFEEKVQHYESLLYRKSERTTMHISHADRVLFLIIKLVCRHAL